MRAWFAQYSFFSRSPLALVSLLKTVRHKKKRKLRFQTQRYTYRVVQTIQMKLKLLGVWAEPAALGSTNTALKFKYEI